MKKDVDELLFIASSTEKKNQNHDIHYYNALLRAYLYDFA